MATVTKGRPAGVTILALLCFIAGGSYAYGTRMIGDWILHPLAGLLINPLAGMMAIVYLAAALVQAGFFIAIGIGLLKMHNWARVVLIVLCLIVLPFAVLGLMGSLMHAGASSLGSLVIVIAIAASMLVYLFKPRVKEVFGATSV
jgi:uncharacterized membrane protein (DUF2068 family)